MSARDDRRPDPVTVTRSVDLDLDVEGAWLLVGRADGLAAWLGHEVEVDLAPGGALRVRDDDGRARRGTVTAVAHRRSLTFTWAPEGDAHPNGLGSGAAEGAGGDAHGPGRGPTARRRADPAPPSTVTIEVDALDDGRARVTVTETLPTTGGRAVACTMAGATWESRLLALELAGLRFAPAFSALA